MALHRGLRRCCRSKFRRFLYSRRLLLSLHRRSGPILLSYAFFGIPSRLTVGWRSFGRLVWKSLLSQRQIIRRLTLHCLRQIVRLIGSFYRRGGG